MPTSEEPPNLQELSSSPIDPVNVVLSKEEAKVLAKPKQARSYQIIHDTFSKRNYAAEIVENDGLQYAELHLLAKKGRLQPIWFNPENANQTKASKTKPHSTWEKWSVLVDDTYLRVGPGPEVDQPQKLNRTKIRDNST